MINDEDIVRWAYLLGPTFQIENTEGRPLTGGWMEVYIHGTRNKYYCASDFDGTLHPFKIQLDSLGANVVLASPVHSYDIYVYNKFGSLVMSRYNVIPATGEGTYIGDIVNIDSPDNTVDVSSDGGTNWNLSIKDTVDRVEQNEQDISDIQEDLADKKDKQSELVYGGNTHMTITKISQNENGEITEVKYEPIDLPPEVPNVEITSPNGTIDVQSSTDVQTNTKTFSIDVNTQVYHDNTMSGAGTVDNPLSVSSSINGLQEQINQKLNVSDYVAPVQSDWNQQDSSSLSYINNKPNLALKEDVSNKAQTLDTSSTIDYPSSKAVADFVNSSIATNTANFLGTYDVVEDLGLSTSATNAQIATALGEYTFATTPTNNDYVFAAIDIYQDTGADEYRRFKFNGTVWEYEYTLNNSSFTQAQWDAINSGIDSSDKTNWNNHVSNTNNPHNVTTSQIGAEPAFTVLPVSKGGTGYNNAPQAASNLLYNLSPATSDIESDDSVFISGNAYQGATDTFFKRPVSALWTYIRNKISSVLGLTASKYNGTADTAVKLPLAWGGFDVQQGYRLLANITAPGSWNDRICTFNVFEKQAGQSDPVGQCGILTVQIRNSNNTFSYGVTYNRSASNKLDIVAKSNTDKSISLYAYSTGNIYGGLQLELVSSSNYTGNPTGREGITLYNNNSLQSTVTGDTVTINNPITYLENDSVTADKVKDNETLPVNITGYASHLRQARCRFINDETGYRLMAYLPPESGYSDAVYVFNIYEARDAAILNKGVLKGTLNICIRNNNGSYQYSSSYTGYSLSDIGLELRVDASLHGVRLYAAKSNQYYCTAIYELLNAYQLNGPEMNPSLYNNNHLSSYIGGTVITPTFTLLKQSGGTIPLADNNGVGSTTTPVYVNSSGVIQACYNRIHDLTLQRKYIRTNGEINGRNILCDRQSWTGTADNPEFATVDPYELAEWINRGDVVNIDLTLYDWWEDKYPGLIVEVQCTTLQGEDRLVCSNIRVLREKIVNQQPTVDFQWSNLITDEDTGNRYMEFQSI